LDSISTLTLSLILFLLIILSGFFSSAETSMMSLNRYRLKNLAKKKHRGAQLTQQLLARPDQLIGLILIGNNFVNILASSIATVICVRLWGNMGYAIATGALTIIILVFSEITPKTLAALQPEKVAFPAAYLLVPIHHLLYPLVRLVIGLTNWILSLFGVDTEHTGQNILSTEELKLVLSEAGALLPKRHKNMLVSVLELEKMTVEDIMIPHSEIIGININESLEIISQQLTRTYHTRVPIFSGDINHVLGFLHVRHIHSLLLLDKKSLLDAKIKQLMNDVHFIPEGTPLNIQLLNFQRKKKRIGFVIDEYGDIQGLLTLERILEEIVGEFTRERMIDHHEIKMEPSGTILINASTHIREINRVLHWNLPIDGPKTLNGLIIEHLEAIPTTGTCLRIMGYPMEILNNKANRVKNVRVFPALYAQLAL
jgi:Mg2+/Co2+ transporter CorB